MESPRWAEFERVSEYSPRATDLRKLACSRIARDEPANAGVPRRRREQRDRVNGNKFTK